MAQTAINNGTTKLYYSIIDGELRRKALPQDDEQYVRRRTNKSGQEVAEFAAGSLTGIIQSIAVVSKEFNGKKVTNLEVTISDVGENYVLQIPVESKYFGSFVEKLPNVDLSQYVAISVYDFLPSGETNRKKGVTIKQNGNKVSGAFSKENPLPGVDAYPANGDDADKKIWAATRTKALKKLVEETQLHILAQKTSGATLEEQGAEPHQPEDDLPF